MNNQMNQNQGFQQNFNGMNVNCANFNNQNNENNNYFCAQDFSRMNINNFNPNGQQNINNNYFSIQNFNNMNQMNNNNNMNMNNMNMNMNNMNNMNNVNMNNMNMNNMNMNNMNMNNMFNQNNMLMNMFNMFNKINNKNIDKNNNNKNGNRNNINKDKPPERIPRKDEQLIFEDNSSMEGELRSINLHASSGLKVMINISKYKTIPDLFKLYVKRIGISESLIGKEIIFIFNAETLTLNDTRLIDEVFPRDASVITVVDQNNVIGAENLGN